MGFDYIFAIRLKVAPMKIFFTKMQGLGNDFVVIDATRQPFKLNAAEIRQMADRHFGIGFDQLLLLEPPKDSKADFSYRVFNADGSEVTQCGNGARCIARYIQDKGLSKNANIRLATKAGVLQLHIEKDQQVTVNMGIPTFDPAQIPFIAEKPALTYPLAVGDEQVIISAVGIGNPHAVLEVPDVGTAPVQTLGAKIEQHPRFPERVNVGFMQILNPQQIRLRVYERGAGETLACGSGACAAVAVGRRASLLADQVQVQLRGGNLLIRWAGGNSPLWMTGPAETVFTGEWVSG